MAGKGNIAPQGWPEGEMEVPQGATPLFTTRTYRHGKGSHRSAALLERFKNGRTSLVFRTYTPQRDLRFKPAHDVVAFSLAEFRAVCVALHNLLQERPELGNEPDAEDV